MTDSVNKESAVREAAAALRKAITEATGAGYRITWPNNPDGLDSIAISETGAVKQPEPQPQPQPQPRFDESSI